MASESKTECRLLALPAELRNRIFGLTVIADEPILVHSGSVSVDEPGLLLTCRQARKEARSMFYANNTFDAFNYPRAMKFIQTLDVTKASQIRALRAVHKSDMYFFRSYAKQHLVNVWSEGLLEACEKRSIRREAVLFPWSAVDEKQTLWVTYDEFCDLATST